MDKGTQTELMLRRLPDGGYLVAKIGGQFDVTLYLYAATTIDEALKYMRDLIEPVGGAEAA